MATPPSVILASTCPPALWRRALFSEFLVLWLCLAYFCALAPFAEGLTHPRNVQNIVGAALPLLLLAIGQTFVLISGGIDLSATATLALASVGGALAMKASGSVAAGLAVMLAIGLAIGFLNGALASRAGMPPFILTLTVMMFGSGLAIWLTQSKGVTGLPSAFAAIGRNFWIALPFTAVLAALAHLLLSRSLFGRWLHAVGHNARTAYISGVPVAAVTTGAYVVSGLCAAVAAALMTARLETGSPVLGQRLLLDVIGATVIGGTSLFGGKGKVLWTLWGVLFLVLVDNSLNLLGLSHFAIMMVKGTVILLAALLDSLRNKLAQTP